MGKNALANLPKGLDRYASSQDIDLAVRGDGGDSRDWRLMMDDYQISDPDSEPLRQEVTRTDLVLQRQWDRPVPPD